MRIAIERVQDPKLIPQDQKWTVEIYKALALEFKELNQYRNTIEVRRDPPQEVADAPRRARDPEPDRGHLRHAHLAVARGDGRAQAMNSAKRARGAHQARPVRRDDPAGSRRTRTIPRRSRPPSGLVRGGLRRAAADHTNAGSALVQQALTVGDKETRDPIFERALGEYQPRRAGLGRLPGPGRQRLRTRTRAGTGSPTRTTWIVVIIVAMDRSPATQRDRGRPASSAVGVRDSNEDDKYLQPRRRTWSSTPPTRRSWIGITSTSEASGAQDASSRSRRSRSSAKATQRHGRER